MTKTKKKAKPSVFEIEIEFDKLMLEFDKRTLNGRSYTDRALYHLIAEHRKDLEGMSPGYFHKAFRQTDVTKSAHIDMAFWQLLQDAPVFWKLMEEMYPE
jgi:hypothetical protein